MPNPAWEWEDTKRKEFNPVRRHESKKEGSHRTCTMNNSEHSNTGDSEWQKKWISKDKEKQAC